MVPRWLRSNSPEKLREVAKTQAERAADARGELKDLRADVKASEGPGAELLKGGAYLAGAGTSGVIRSFAGGRRWVEAVAGAGTFAIGAAVKSPMTMRAGLGMAARNVAELAEQGTDMARSRLRQARIDREANKAAGAASVLETAAAVAGERQVEQRQPELVPAGERIRAI